MSRSERKPCKDCGSTTRSLGHPGPRCSTCWRVVQKHRKEQAHDRHIQATYGIDALIYGMLLEAQGGKCAICLKATGAHKKLAVDHDHDTGEIRGLLCVLCNRYLLGYAGEMTLRRALHYLQEPPARKVLAKES